LEHGGFTMLRRMAIFAAAVVVGLSAFNTLAPVASANAAGASVKFKEASKLRLPPNATRSVTGAAPATRYRNGKYNRMLELI
jgi:hypothetical protein